MTIDWQWLEYGEIPREYLYEMLKLRQDVFIIEQACVYPDIDGLDENSLHLFGRDETGSLAAYLRIVEPGARFEEPSIGRVVTCARLRGKGLGRSLMIEGIRKCRGVYPDRPIRIAAQHRLEGFYGSLGFQSVSRPYVEDDGIMHIDMALSPDKISI